MKKTSSGSRWHSGTGRSPGAFVQSASAPEQVNKQLLMLLTRGLVNPTVPTEALGDSANQPSEIRMFIRPGSGHAWELGREVGVFAQKMINSLRCFLVLSYVPLKISAILWFSRADLSQLSLTTHLKFLRERKYINSDLLWCWDPSSVVVLIAVTLPNFHILLSDKVRNPDFYSITCSLLL